MRDNPALLVALVATLALSSARAVGETPDTSKALCTIASDGTTSCDEPGETPDAPLVTSPIQTLIDAAAPGDTILIGPGTYVGGLKFHGKNVTLRSTDGPDVTTIDGGTIDIGPGGTVIGFTIKNARAYFGAAFEVHGVGTLIQGNVIRDNVQMSGGYGAGIGGNSASPMIANNTFRNNSCDGQSGAGVVALVNGSSPTIVNNVFEDNPCPAISMGLPEGFLPVVINNTIVRNRVGIHVDRRIPTVLQVYENNAIFGNTIGLQVEFGSNQNNPTWKYNLVFGNTVNYDLIPDQTGLNGNISADPRFVNAAAGDYRIDVSSPAVDAGDNNAPRLPATDFNGDARILDGNSDALAIVDIGADEYAWWNRTPIAQAGPPQTLECHGSAPVATLLDGSYSTDSDSTPGTNDDIVAFDWFESFGLPSQSMLGSGEQLPASFSGGTHHVTLRVTDQAGATGVARVFVFIQSPVSCDDGNPCTADSVTPSCTCEHVLTPGVACNDADACTTAGTCDASGACVGISPVNCNDGNVCTTDTCDHLTGCGHMNNTNACDDFNKCTSPDTCTTGFCVGTPLENGTACDDHNMCTTADACYWGWCYGGSDVGNGTACDDSNPCTTGEQCMGSSCVVPVPFVQPPGSPLAAFGPVGVGDFNLDGKPDLVSQSTSDNSALAVFLGDGSGGFTQTATLYVASGLYPSFNAVADMNLDGRPDIAVIQSYSNQSSVVTFLGNGAGGFVLAPGPATPVGSYPTAFVTGEFNNDGKPDVAAVSDGDQAVSILLGNGSGGFVARPPVAAGSSPHAVATGDFNLDGKLDLALANPVTNGGVTILIGDGTGGLSPGPGSPYAAGYGPYSIAVGDFDQDGDPDLAVANAGFTSTTISMFAGNGKGAFGPAYPIDASGYPYSVVAADVDLDGRLDLVIGSQDFFVQVLLGTGSIYYFRPAGPSIYLPGEDIRLAAGDFDRDGRTDVVASTNSPDEVRVLLNRSVGMACPNSDGCTANVCNPANGQCVPVPRFTGNACDDHNGCTTNDACSAGSCIGAAVTCAAVDQCHLPGACDPSSGCTDLHAPEGSACTDGDSCTQVDTCASGDCIGHDPVTCPDQGQCQAGVCDPASGACGLVPRPERTTCDDGAPCTAGDGCHAGVCQSGLSFSTAGSPIHSGDGPAPLELANLNGDVNLDLAVVNEDGDTVVMLAGDGAGGFSPMSAPIALPHTPNSIAIADFDLDGVPDLAITSHYSNPSGYVSVLLGRSGGYVGAPGSPFTVGREPRSIVAGDFNLDGRPDLVLGLSSFPYAARLYLGDGTGRFDLQTRVYSVDYSDLRLAVADLDLDGKPDLLISSRDPSGPLKIYFGFATGGTRISTIWPTGGCATTVVADVNADARPDVVCAGSSKYSVLLADSGTNFAPAPGSPFPADNYLSVRGLVDFNLDGKLDLVTSSRSSNAVRILLGDGTGRFDEAACSPIQGFGDLQDVVMGDFNSDGKVDFAAADYFRDTVSIFLGAPSLSPDGTPCSDDNACTAGDACHAGICSSTPIAPPDEVKGLLFSGRNESTLTWTPVSGSARYDVTASTISDLRAHGTATAACRSNSVSGNSLLDGTIPAPDDGTWYLIRAQTPCGSGSYGNDSSGSLRLSGTACP